MPRAKAQTAKRRNSSGRSQSTGSTRRSTSQPPPTTPNADGNLLQLKDAEGKLISPRSELANEMKRNFSINKDLAAEANGTGAQQKKLKVSNSSDDMRMQVDTDDLPITARETSSKLSLHEDSYLLKQFQSLQAGTILVVGNGETGQLGLGPDIYERKKPFPVKLLSDKKIKVITAGGMHTGCITEDHEIYTWGCNDEGALGRACADDEEEMVPAQVNLPDDAGRAVLITSGDSHCAVLDDRGQVFVWGNFRDGSGVLGLVCSKTKAVAPVQLVLDEFVVKIASGADHLALLANSGVAYTFGTGEVGQLGRGGRYFSDRGGRRGASFVLKPAPVRFNRLTRRHRLSFNQDSPNQPITPRQGPLTPSQSKNRCIVDNVFCSGMSTFITSDNKIYSFGLNNYQQLGHYDKDNRFVPTCSEEYSVKQWDNICGGDHHVIALDTDHNVWSIGRGDDGRMGVVDPEKMGEKEQTYDESNKLIKLDLPNTEACHPVQISSRSAVGYCRMSDGTGYSWGFGTCYQLTNGDDEDVNTPMALQGGRIQGKRLLSIACGGQHGVLIVDMED